MSRTVYRLPPYRVDRVLTKLDDAERIDWGLSLLEVPSHWHQTEGAGVKVAVLDTGIDANHPDLQSAIDGQHDFTGSRIGTADAQGHGTHTAGIAAARRNQLGVVGVAPECRLLIGKVLGDDGSGLGAWVAAGIDWACDQGADIISMSLGSPFADPTIYAAIQRAAAKGKFVIAAAGNDGGVRGQDRVDYPGRWPETIAVAAFDRQRQLASFSSQGPEVDIAAPGEAITSTFPLNQGGYAILSGTSMATPFVAGVVALVLAWQRQNLAVGAPIADVNQLRARLAQTATDAGPPGQDWGFGFGLISPNELLSAENASPAAGSASGGWQIGPVVLHMPAVAGDLASLRLA
ncbi:MAG TPA: S8 family peptidase [Pirellulales bacterium]|jgi:subtilisin family serine protease|nr:S8 family peptidase [Pirellulales bacterium]